MTSILFMTHGGEPPPGGIAGVGEDELMRACFVYLVSSCNFFIFRLFNISAQRCIFWVCGVDGVLEECGTAWGVIRTEALTEPGLVWEL